GIRAVDLQRDVLANINVADVRKRVRGQIVGIRRSEGRVVEEYRSAGRAKRCITIDDVAAIPIGLRIYKDLAQTGQINFEGLPIERQVSELKPRVLEGDLLKAAEVGQAAEVERSGTDQIEHVHARSARQAVARVQRRRVAENGRPTRRRNDS